MLQGEREMAARQQDARQVPPDEHPAGAARHAADRGHLRHRRQRHRERLRQGPRAPARSRRSPSPAPRRCPTTRSTAWSRTPSRHADGGLRKRKEEVEARNDADTLVYGTEKTLKDLGDKVPADTRSSVEDAVGEAKKALEGSDVEAIKAQTEKLREASYKLAEVVYSDASAGEGAEGAGASGQPSDESSREDEEEVVDAEVVDDDNK